MESQHEREYDIQILPDQRTAWQTPHASFVNQWIAFVARAAQASFVLYAVVRLIFLVVSVEVNRWMWIVFFVECAIAYQISQGQTIAISVQKYGNPNLAQHCDRLRLVGDCGNSNADLPLVDVLVTCCGESLSVISDTLRAACKIEYPPNRFRVLVLDDGQSPALQMIVEEMHQTWDNIQYHSRRSAQHDQRVFNKADNLNYALFDIQAAMIDPPEYVAVLDADFMPSPSFLRATLPHLIRFPKLALAGAPQDFYNLPVGDPLIQSLDHWQNVLTPQLNQLGSTFHGHSGCVIRRSVLLQSQGFPTISFFEDFTLSNILIGTGWQIVSLRELLQLGRVPESIQGHVSQRRRWVIALSQLILALKSTYNNTVPPALRWPIAYQGIMVVVSLTHRVLAQLMVPLALLSGHILVPAASPLQLKLQGYLAIVSLSLAWAFERIQVARSNYHGAVFGDLEEIWMAPGFLWAIFGFWCLPTQSGGSFVTGSLSNTWNDNPTEHRLSQLRRDLWGAGIIVNVLSFLGLLAAMLYAAHRGQNSEEHLQCLLWPPILQLCYMLLSSNWIPLACTVFPPSWTNAITSAMKLGMMESHAMFTKSEFQCSVRMSRRPLGSFGHYAMVPLVLTALFYALMLI